MLFLRHLKIYGSLYADFFFPCLFHPKRKKRISTRTSGGPRAKTKRNDTEIKERGNTLACCAQPKNTSQCINMHGIQKEIRYHMLNGNTMAYCAQPKDFERYKQHKIRIDKASSAIY